MQHMFRAMFGFEGTIYLNDLPLMAQWLSWLERRPVTAEVAGSSPAGVVRSENK